MKFIKNFRLKEWHRTIILVVLLFVGIGVIYWANSNVDENFVDQFIEP
ncbi:MAG: hypothetical protein AAF413_04685 [Patescibacteria group bacterium]